MFSTMLLSEMSLLNAFTGVVSVLLLGKIAFNVVRFWLAPYQSPLRKLPGPPSKHWYLGWTTKDDLADLSASISQMHARYGTVFYGRGVHRSSNLYVTDEVALNYIFQNEYSPRGPELFRVIEVSAQVFRIFFGSTIFIAEKDVHRRQRRAMLPAFTESAIRQASSVMYEVVHDLMDLMHKDLTGKVEEMQIDILPYFRDATLDTIGRAGFGRDLGALNRKTSEMHDRFLDLTAMMTSPSLYACARIYFPWIRHLGSFFSKEEITVRAHRKGNEAFADELVESIAQESEKGSVEYRSILHLMKRTSSTCASNEITDTELRQSVPSLLLAGFETTSISLTWAIHCLTKDAGGLERQARLRDELNADQHQGWQTDFNVLDGMPYLDAVCTEVLRLCPAVGYLGRMCWQDTVIPLSKPIILRDGTMTNQIPIKKGDCIYISCGSINRNVSVWGEKTNEFLPERWLRADHIYFDENLAIQNNSQLSGWNRMATFGQGVRTCLGIRFALAEIKIVLAYCIANYGWNPVIDPKNGKPIQIQSCGPFINKVAIKGAEKNHYSLPVRVKKIK